MKHVKRQGLAIGLLSLLSVPAFAATPNDEEKYRGDMLRYSFRTTAKVETDQKIKNAKGEEVYDTQTVCIPPKTELRGLGKVGMEDLEVRISKDTPGAKRVEGTNSKVVVMSIDSCDATPTKLFTDRIYTIKGGLADNRTPDRFGLTYGALVVPYKYHFDGSKSFGSNASVGPFVGWRFARENIGVTWKLIGFAGASVIKVDRMEDGESKSDDIAAFSYGAGVIMELKNEFQLGFILGADEVGNDTDYEDDGKLWAAIAIGFAFGT